MTHSAATDLIPAFRSPRFDDADAPRRSINDDDPPSTQSRRERRFLRRLAKRRRERGEYPYPPEPN